MTVTGSFLRTTVKSKSNARDYIIRNLTLFTGNHFDILQHTQRRSSQWRKTHTDTRTLGMTSLRTTTRSFVRRRVRDCTSSSRRKQVRYSLNKLNVTSQYVDDVIYLSIVLGVIDATRTAEVILGSNANTNNVLYDGIHGTQLSEYNSPTLGKRT